MGADAVVQMGGPKSPTLSTRSSRDYNTGFPEPFCGRGNTTLRHPDADTSPGACISANDIDVNRALTRSRGSFLNKNKRTTLNHGKLTHADLASYNDLSAITETPTRSNVSSSSGSIRDDSRLSKDGGESIGRPPSSSQSDQSLLQRSVSGGSSRPSTSHGGLHPRGSVLRKIRLRN